MKVRQNYTLDLSLVKQFHDEFEKGERSKAVEKALAETYNLKTSD